MVEEKKVTDTHNIIPRFVACQFAKIKKNFLVFFKMASSRRAIAQRDLSSYLMLILYKT